MDLERFKKKRPTIAQPKRAINDAGKVTHKPNTATFAHNASKNTVAPSARMGSLFDDDDIFGVWNKQKQIKQQLKQEEQAKKAAKKAAKQQKKLEKQRKEVARKASGAPRKLELSLKVPSLSHGKSAMQSAKQTMNYEKSHRKYYVWGTILVGLPVLLVGFSIVHQLTKPDTKPAVQGASTQVSSKPDFSTLKPTTVENQATSIKYDTTKKVASYNDVLADVPITVSQQPLPSGFEADPTGKVADLAKQINANDKISTSDVTAYAGLSIKGPQTVVFTKNDLLIFIYADKKIDVLTWEKYIESMQTK